MGRRPAAAAAASCGHALTDERRHLC
eukprot:COSAG05_NODE_8339_length_713_cov_0.615635_1_plen_25_part_10